MLAPSFDIQSTIPESQRYALIPRLINIVEDIFVFVGLNSMQLFLKKSKSHLIDKTKLKLTRANYRHLMHS